MPPPTNTNAGQGIANTIGGFFSSISNVAQGISDIGTTTQGLVNQGVTLYDTVRGRRQPWDSTNGITNAQQPQSTYVGSADTTAASVDNPGGNTMLVVIAAVAGLLLLA